MPRHPKDHFVFPFPIALKEKSASPRLEVYPAFIVKGVLRGLLEHLWHPSQRPDTEKDMSSEKMEVFLMDFIDTGTKEWNEGSQPADEPQSAENSFITLLSRQIPSAFKSMKGHSWFILTRDSKLILWYLRDYYAPISGPDERLKWLQNELGEILVGLKQYTWCSCKGHVDLPDQETLEGWSVTPHAGKLQHAILGHFHSIAPSTVKRILSSPPRGI